MGVVRLRMCEYYVRVVVRRVRVGERKKERRHWARRTETYAIWPGNTINTRILLNTESYILGMLSSEKIYS